MARSIATIKELVRQTKNTYPALAQALFPNETDVNGIPGSLVGLLNLEADTFSQEVNIFEQLLDAYNNDITNTVDASVPVTDQWIAAEVLKFQYSTSIPQFIEVSAATGFLPMYAVVDPTLYIISQCSVVTLGSGAIVVKAATGTPPGPLDGGTLNGPQFTALKSYVAQIIGAGVKFTLNSLAADRVFIQATIYYDGSFINSIQTDVPAAITNDLSSIPFNGNMLASGIEQAILAAPGVKDVVFTAPITARADANSLTALVDNRYWPTVAGYIIPENASGETLADTLTYQAI